MQQNAGFADRAASTANTMRDQANQLTRILAFFSRSSGADSAADDAELVDQCDDARHWVKSS